MISRCYSKLSRIITHRLQSQSWVELLARRTRPKVLGLYPLSPSLRRSHSSTSQAAGRPIQYNRTITNLNPSRLTRSDFVNLAGSVSCRVHIASCGDVRGDRFTLRYKSVRASEHKPAQQCALPFPKDTHGFLYYFTPDACHPAAGQLRFRCTEGEDPVGFAAGYDLLTPSGLPWSISIATIIRTPSYTCLRELLLQEGHVSNKLLQSCVSLEAYPRSAPVVYSLQQPFVWRVKAGRLSLWVAYGCTLRLASIWSEDLVHPRHLGPQAVWLEAAAKNGLTGIAVRLLTREPVLHGDTLQAMPAFRPTGDAYFLPLRERIKTALPLLQLLPPAGSSSHTQMSYPLGSGWQRSISTLMPAKLRASDFVDLSSLRITTMSVKSHKGGSDSRFRFTFNRRLPFPPGTHGFLYFTPGPAAAPLAGELRMRVTQTADPALFHTGHDAETSPGVAWFIPLVTMLHSKTHAALVELLEREGVLASADVHRWRADKAHPRIPQALILCSPHQQFRLDVDQWVHQFWYTAGDAILAFRFRWLFAESPRSGRVRPFRGELLCQFEFIRSADGAQKQAVIRVVDALKQVTCVEGYRGRLPMPATGSLLMRASGKPWTYVEGSGKPALDIAIRQAFSSDAPCAA